MARQPSPIKGRTDPMDLISAVCYEGKHEKCGGKVWWHISAKDVQANPDVEVPMIPCECECHNPPAEKVTWEPPQPEQRSA